MIKNRSESLKNGEPIENHRTAAWADIKTVKPVSQVPIPDEDQMHNAKDWVDANEK